MQDYGVPKNQHKQVITDIGIGSWDPKDQGPQQLDAC